MTKEPYPYNVLFVILELSVEIKDPKPGRLRIVHVWLDSLYSVQVDGKIVEII